MKTNLSKNVNSKQVEDLSTVDKVLQMIQSGCNIGNTLLIRNTSSSR